MKKEPSSNVEQTIEAVWDSAQEWMQEHKVVTALAVGAFLYLMGGKRIRALAGLAVRSGLAAGVANTALSMIPVGENKREANEDLSYH